MEPPYEVVVYHHFENWFDERAIEQTKQAPAAEELPTSPEQADLQPKKEESFPPPPKRHRRERITFTPLHPEVPRDQRHDFHITDDALGHGTPSEKYAAARASSLTAFYTPPVVIRGIYKVPRSDELYPREHFGTPD